MARAIDTITTTLTLTAVALSGCIGDDLGGGTTEIAETTAVGTTGGEETSGESTDAWTDETTDGKGSGLCGALVWAHVNPPVVPGGGGPSWYRSFGVDLTGCDSGHDVKVAIVPTGDSALILTLGDRKPGCILFGASEAAGAESVGFPIGQNLHWSAMSAVVMLDDTVTDTVDLPTMVAPEDQPFVMDGLTDRALFRFDGAWWLAPVGELPACW